MSMVEGFDNGIVEPTRVCGCSSRTLYQCSFFGVFWFLEIRSARSAHLRIPSNNSKLNSVD